MLTFSETYSLLKDLVDLAKRAKNQEMVNLATKIQVEIFETKEESEKLKDTIRELKREIQIMESANIAEEELEYSTRGYIVKKGETPPIPYCSFCWKKERRLLPLSQYNGWYNFRCANCKSDIVVMTADGRQLGRNKDKED